MKRAIFASVALVLSSLSSATLIQVWNKAYTVGGDSVIFNDVVLDSTGNVYTVGTTTGTNSDVVAMKTSPAGSTLWTNRISRPLYQGGNDIALDAAGNLIIANTIENASTQTVELRRLRATDGATLDTATFDDPGYIEADFGELIADDSGQLYWFYTDFTPGNAGTSKLVVVKINVADLSASPRKVISLPNAHSFIDAEARPGGGIVLLIGSADPDGTGGFLDGRFFDADLYFVDSLLDVKTVPAGYTSRIARNLLDNQIYGANGPTTTTNQMLGRWRMPVNGPYGGAFNESMLEPDIILRDVISTKNGILVGGSANMGGSRGVEPFFAQIGTDPAMTVGSSSTIFATSGSEKISSLRVDGYFGISAVQTDAGFTNSKVYEIDDLTLSTVDSRSYTYFIRAHAVNAAGMIAVAGNSGGVTLLKPRDLKDIYMSATSMTGGTSRTLITRMYEPHTAARTVSLSDNGANLTLPASATIPAAGTTASVTVTTTPVAAAQVVRITAAFGSQRRTFTVTVTP